MKFSTYLFVFVFLSLQFAGVTQVLNIEHFETEDGIKNPFINTIDKDRKGYLVVGTGEGIYRYDGYRFHIINPDHTEKENVVDCSFSDRHGNLWFGLKGGSIWIFDGQGFEILDVKQFGSSKIVGFAQDHLGNVWAATQTNGVLRINPDKEIWQYSNSFEGLVLNDILISDQDYCYLSTDLGLYHLELPTRDKGVLNLSVIPSMEYISTTCLVESHFSNRIFVGTEDDGVYYFDRKYSKEKSYHLNPELGLDQHMIYDLDEDDQGNLWVSTRGASLLKVIAAFSKNNRAIVESFNKDGNLESDNVKTVFIDAERNIWIGKFGKGLSKYEQRFFSFYELDTKEVPSVMSVEKDGQGLCLGSFGEILFTTEDPRNILSKLDTSNGLPEDNIISTQEDTQGNLWIGTRQNGLFVRKKGMNSVEPYIIMKDRITNAIYDLEITTEGILVATGGGLYLIGEDWKTTHLSTSDGLPHNLIKTLYKNGERVYLGTRCTALYYYQKGEIKNVPIFSETVLMDITGFAIDAKNQFWICTAGAGVFKITDSTVDGVRKAQGLYSNFCYGIAIDGDGAVWVSHNGGLSRIGDKIESFSKKEGVSAVFQLNAMQADRIGNLWFGSDLGLVKYERAKDTKSFVEPSLNVTGVQVGDTIIENVEDIQLDYGDYKIKFNFVGLSYKKVEKVTYQYFLEGHDLEWSENTKSRFAQYNWLEPGDYTFHVKTFNADGFGGADVHTISLSIARPFWQKIWFYLIAAAVILLVVRALIIRREKLMRANQMYLQNELDQRTKEVVSQKELLEMRNKDVTDSIVYAKSIQKAMLPAQDELKDYFQESFVFFKPRDIVSGDFYWVKRFENKVILVCADCTGHGVPGAFMSLISIALLREVSSDRFVLNPKIAMERLQEQMLRVFKADPNNKLRDGMDLSLVEYDLDSRIIRICSARRPVVLYSKEKVEVIDGDRFSIGEDREEGVFEFSMHTRQLDAGDSFYMFSDGITDQFGGKRGKKLKKAGLLSFLDTIHSDEMVQQEDKVKKFYMNWLRDYEQVDDIILMGARVS